MLKAIIIAAEVSKIDIRIAANHRLRSTRERSSLVAKPRSASLTPVMSCLFACIYKDNYLYVKKATLP
jgi:hypothetical protein